MENLDSRLNDVYMSDLSDANKEVEAYREIYRSKSPDNLQRIIDTSSNVDEITAAQMLLDEHQNKQELQTAAQRDQLAEGAQRELDDQSANDIRRSLGL